MYFQPVKLISQFKRQKGWLRRQSFKKLRNAFELGVNFERARISGKPLVAPYPLSISIEPTTSCNLRCPECPSGLRSFTRPTGMLEPALFRKLINEVHPWLTNLTFYFQGEPFLNPNLTEMISYASAKGIYQTISTNAHYLDPETACQVVHSGLDHLIISLDGVTQEVYEQYRVGGKLSKVLEGTKNILEARKSIGSQSPFITLQFLVVKHNEHQIDELKILASELGVDELKLKTAQIYNYENGSPLIPENLKYSRYLPDQNGKWKIRSEWENKCWKMWSSSVITWDGRVLPCCFDKDAKYQMGNINQQSFAEIWSGEKYDQFRSAILKSRADIDICRNCTEGLASASSA